MKKRGAVVVPLIKAPATPKKQKTNLAPMPQVIRPALPPIRNRRLVDSALGKRPTSTAPEPEESPAIEVSRLPVHSVESMQTFEAELLENPATSRSSAVLALLPGLNSANPTETLDQILIATRSWANDSVISLDFRVYHLLTQSVFTLIKEQIEHDLYSELLMKALAVCVKVMPASDRLPLGIVLKCLYKMSQNEDFDSYFLSCAILKPLMDLAFADYGDVSMNAAAILRHVSEDEDNASELIKRGVVKLICTSLRTDRRRERFTHEKALWVYQVIGLFSSIYDSLEDFGDLCKYSLPRWLLDLTTIYSTDVGLQAAISKALTQMMTREDCVEVIEDADITPFFILMTSKVPKVVNHSTLALANAMSISEMISDTAAEMPPPFGVYGLCELLKTTKNFDLKVSIMRCLAKCSETKPGIDAIQLFLQHIVPLLDTPMDEIEVWSPDQILVANVLVVLKNLAIVDPVKSAECLKGKMNQLMVYGILDYVIELMRVLLKCPEGKEVCDEVKDVEEIRLILQDAA